MTQFLCPLCRRSFTPRREGVVRMWHNCHLNPTHQPVELVTGGRRYEIYCGNYDCASRLAGRTHPVPDDELVDGEIWLCEDCRTVPADV